MEQKGRSHLNAETWLTFQLNFVKLSWNEIPPVEISLLLSWDVIIEGMSSFYAVLMSACKSLCRMRNLSKRRHGP